MAGHPPCAPALGHGAMTDRGQVRAALRQQWIETPSWAYGNSGTRFKVFAQEGVARNAFEKIEDAAQVHDFTGVAPSVALHIPWDQVDDYDLLAKHAAEHGIRIGAINPNVFQEPEYRLGSVCNPDPAVRQKAFAHLLYCIDVAKVTGSATLSLWFADGTNYPGQDSLRSRQGRLAEALAQTYEALGPGCACCWSTSSSSPPSMPPTSRTGVHRCRIALPWGNALVLVDTGHHAPGTNIEFIVCHLLRAKRLGGFHFNSRFYADDDLMVGAADPFQLFRIMHEIVSADALRPTSGVAFMLDQCHNIEPKIPAEIRSVMNVQEATAKALLVDQAALAAAQEAGDVLGAYSVLVDAYNTDVRPLLAEVRSDMGRDPDPLGAYSRSGYAERIVTERATGQAAGWGA